MNTSLSSGDLIEDIDGASPAIRDRALEARIHIKEKKSEAKIERMGYRWQSCCFSVDSRFVIYITQLCLIASMMGYSCYQLAKEDDPGKNQVWVSLLSLLLGVIVPNPRIAEERE